MLGNEADRVTIKFSQYNIAARGGRFITFNGRGADKTARLLITIFVHCAQQRRHRGHNAHERRRRREGDGHGRPLLSGVYVQPALNLCQEAFARSDTLKQHHQTHNRDTPFKREGARYDGLR